jgi:CRISPR-associated protein Csd1
MILQALCEYYERARGETGVPEPGFSRQKIHFALVIDSDGNPLQVRDLRIIQKNKPWPKELIRP